MQTHPPAARTNWRDPRRWKRILLYWLPGALSLYTLVGFVLVPALITRVIVPRIERRLNATVSLERAQTNPFTFRLRLERLVVRDLKGDEVLGLETFDARFFPIVTLFSRGWHFGEIRLEKPRLNVHIEADGTLVLATLLKPSDAPPRPLRSLPRLVARELSVSGATLSIRDLSTPRPFEKTITDAGLTLKNIDTRPGQSNEHTITATTGDGATISWRGTIDLNPLDSKGTLTIRALTLEPFMAYAMRWTDVTLERGVLEAELDYVFAPAASPRVVRADVRSARVSDASVKVPWQPWLRGGGAASTPSVVISGLSLDADQRSATLASLAIEQGETSLALFDGPPVPERVRDALIGAARSPLDVPTAAPSTRPDLEAIPYPLERLLTGLEVLLSDVLQPWSLRVESVTLRDHALTFTDRAAPEPVEVRSIVRSLSAGPLQSSDRFTTPFSATVEAAPSGTLVAEGTLLPLDRRVRGTARAERLNVRVAGAYLPASALSPLPPGRLGDTIADLDGTFDAQLPVEGGATTSWSGSAVLAPLVFEARDGGEPVLKADRLEVRGDASLKTNPAADVDVSWKGTLSGQKLAGLAALLGEIRAKADGVNVEGDAAVRRSAEGAEVCWSGTASVSNASASATELSGPVEASVGSGRLQGSAHVDARTGAPPALTLSGTAVAEAIRAKASTLDNADVAIAKLEASDLRVESAGPRLAASRVGLDGLVLSLSRALAPISAEASSTEASARPPLTLAGRLPVELRIEEFALSGGRVELDDTTFTPASKVMVEDLTVRAAPVHSDGSSPLTLEVGARLQNSGRLQVTGAANPFVEGVEADLRVQVSTLPLPAYSAVSGKFLGYKISDGRLSSTIPVTVRQNAMRGEIDFLLDRIALGDKVASADAPSVPIELGLSLLKDSNDQIKSRIPFEGNLTDPKFSLGGVVWQAVMNLVVKAATAPFQILGALFGAGEQDLSRAVFEPGSADLSPETISALDALAKGMSERPRFSLRVIGRVEPESDDRELRRRIVREGHAERAFGKGSTRALNERELLEQTKIAFDELRLREAQAQGQPPPASVRRIASDAAPAPPLAEMEEALMKATTVPPERFADLAKRRAEAVAAFMTGEKKIDAARVKVEAAKDGELEAKAPEASFEIF